MTHEEIMKLGAEEADYTMSHNIGGPFGAVIMKGNEIVAVASNSVLKDNDPTAHAEVNAIRLACRNLGTYDLSGCELYATGYPCPMCLSAIMWANIKKVYVSGLPVDAEEIGFRDKFMYDYIHDLVEVGKNEKVLDIIEIDRSIGKNLYSKYKENEKEMY